MAIFDCRLGVALTGALCLLATPALADVAGPAKVIDGDTIEVHGQRLYHALPC